MSSQVSSGSVRTVSHVVALISAALATASYSAEPEKDCSGSAFLARDYQWSGIPVMRNARQSAGDGLRCLYVVPVSVPTAEQWHSQKLTEQGWQWTGRQETERGVELEFRQTGLVLRVAISDIQLGTAILLKRPTFESKVAPATQPSTVGVAAAARVSEQGR